MYTWSRDDVEDAIETVCSTLDIAVDTKLLDEYENGRHRDLLIYEKLQDCELSIDLPAVQKYLISCKSFLDQPCQYYDIFRACRHTTFLQVLSSALQSVRGIENYEEKIAILRGARSYEEFEACLFELATASRYLSKESVSSVRFTEKGSSESPDLSVVVDGQEHFVECKKYNRAVDVSYTIRNEVRARVQRLFEGFRTLGYSALLEISFHTHPQHISERKILDHSMESYRFRCPIVDADFTVRAEPLEPRVFPDYILYPSPKYFWERYGFRDGREWFGLVHASYCQMLWMRSVSRSG